MKLLKFSFLLFLVFSTLFSRAQENQVANFELDNASLGIGMGFDNGGFGGSFLYYPIPKVGLFIGAGYPLAGFGYNFGAKFRFISQNSSKINFYLIGMYGYNSAIYIANDEKYNKLFYGPTYGLGIDTKYKRTNTGYWSFAVLIPMRGAEVDNYINDLKKNHNVEFNSSLLPFAFSIGYRIVIDYI